MPDTEITRAETRKRARLLHVRSYDVEFDFTGGPDTFGSVSLIRFDCRAPGSTAHADLIATGVRAITLNGVPLDPATAWANGRITLPRLAASNELRVIADCAYTSSGTGMHRADSADGSVRIYAKLAQAHARTAYACFDQPDLKAVFTVRVTAPARWVVLSNQPPADIERTLHDSQTVRFQPTPPLPTFTTTVVAGDYHLVTASHTTPGGQQIPLELACRAALADRLDVDALLRLTARGLDYYAGWLDADYPYAKYGQVFVPEFPHLASENAGCALIAERLLFPSSQASPALIESRTGTVLHEMAHMWFGDSATQEGRDDLWLSESFAEFCEARASRTRPERRRLVDDVVHHEDPGLPRRPAAVRARGGVRRVDDQRRDRELRRDHRREGRGSSAAAIGGRGGGALLHAGLRAYIARVCWNTVIDMVRQAELPVSAFAAMLARAMRSEKPPVLSALWQQADWLLARFASPGQATEARLASVPSDAGRRNAAACRAAIPDAGHKEAAWRLLTSETAGPETVTRSPGIHAAVAREPARPVRRLLPGRDAAPVADAQRPPAGTARDRAVPVSGGHPRVPRAARPVPGRQRNRSGPGPDRPGSPRHRRTGASRPNSKIRD